MKKALVFKTLEAYENWTDQFKNCYEYQEIPIFIDDTRLLSMDLMTACKSWKTALRRFEKTFGDFNPEILTWIKFMRESCESGQFKDHREEDPGNKYGWEVEELYDGYWYIFLNISGVYAGR